MYVLGICGSPRKGGNTDVLLDKALEGAESKGAMTEKITLNDLNMKPCQECPDMPDDGTCKIRDDFPPLWEKIKKADGLILASPVFFGSLSAQTKIMIDRSQCAWRYKYVLKKPSDKPQIPGILILTEASERDDFLANAKAIIRNFFATAGIKYKNELFCRGLEGKLAASRRPDLLETAREAGRGLL